MNAESASTPGNPRGLKSAARYTRSDYALARSSALVSITEGTPWIRDRNLEHLPYIDAMMLDFFHLSEYIRDTAKCCLDEWDGARKRAEEQLHEVKHLDPAGILAAIVAIDRKVRSTTRKKRLRLLRGYITERWEMLDYRRAVSRPAAKRRELTQLAGFFSR